MKMESILSNMHARHVVFRSVLLLAMLSMGIASGCGGCGSKHQPPPASKHAAKKAANHPQKAAKKGTSAMAKRREIFGLPLPPSVIGIGKHGERYRVTTDMPHKELVDFFKSRLTDYELLEPGGRVRFVGLRDYMPSLKFLGFGKLTYVIYIPADESPKAHGGAKADAHAPKKAAAHKAEAANEHHAPKHTYGAPVLDRTADGKLLAPGARWGVPYTPPKGSPLHNKHYRSNWGRPYGKWTMQ